jgi:hypothetical protein
MTAFSRGSESIHYQQRYSGCGQKPEIPMRPIMKPETINASSLLRGLIELPWGASLFGAWPGEAPRLMPSNRRGA